MIKCSDDTRGRDGAFPSQSWDSAPPPPPPPPAGKMAKISYFGKFLDFCPLNAPRQKFSGAATDQVVLAMSYTKQLNFPVRILSQHAYLLPMICIRKRWDFFQDVVYQQKQLDKICCLPCLHDLTNLCSDSHAPGDWLIFLRSLTLMLVIPSW